MLTLECNAGIRKKNTLYFVTSFLVIVRSVIFWTFRYEFHFGWIVLCFFFITHLRSSLLVWSLLGTFLLLLFPFFRFVVSFILQSSVVHSFDFMFHLFRFVLFAVTNRVRHSVSANSYLLQISQILQWSLISG